MIYFWILDSCGLRYEESSCVPHYSADCGMDAASLLQAAENGSGGAGRCHLAPAGALASRRCSSLPGLFLGGHSSTTRDYGTRDGGCPIFGLPERKQCQSERRRGLRCSE